MRVDSTIGGKGEVNNKAQQLLNEVQIIKLTLTYLNSQGCGAGDSRPFFDSDLKVSAGFYTLSVLT